MVVHYIFKNKRSVHAVILIQTMNVDGEEAACLLWQRDIKSPMEWLYSVYDLCPKQTLWQTQTWTITTNRKSLTEENSAKTADLQTKIIVKHAYQSLEQNLSYHYRWYCSFNSSWNLMIILRNNDNNVKAA